MTSPDRPDQSNRPTAGTGASAIGEEKRTRKPWWLLILLAAIIVVALILLLSRCGGDDNTANALDSATSAAGSAASSATGSPSDNADVSTPAATSPAAGAPAAGTTAATAAAAAGGSLTANGTSLLPIATAGGGDLSRYVGQAAAATNVLVLSAPADNGFWVGTSTTDQVYVHLLQPGLVSPHPVQTGDHISFTGNVVANAPTLAAADGVDAAEGADQLTAQKAHIEIAKSSVVFVS